MSINKKRVGKKRVGKKRVVKIGNVSIGGDNPIAIQSMTNTKTQDVRSTAYQINQLAGLGCEIVRVAVPNLDAANVISNIKTMISIPIVADIHYDYKLAIAAIKNGADKIRINPGNIGGRNNVRRVAKVAADFGVPIRIGANSGSVKKELVQKMGMSKALVASAAEQVEILQSVAFQDIVLAIKSTDILETYEAVIELDKLFEYPQHIGITESGTLYNGIIKSSVGIGAMLCAGIGSTIRVSLTADPIEEIKCAKSILAQLGLRNFGPKIISCPTCGRTEVDLINMAERVEREVANLNSSIQIAVMGCSVNGPGEASEADIGIAGGKGKYVLFRKGEIIGSFAEEEAYNMLIEEIKRIDNV